MITAEMEVETSLDVDEGDSDYEYVYPQELLEEWVEISRDMDEKIARGELKPQTIAEIAAEFGVTLD